MRRIGIVLFLLAAVACDSDSGTGPKTMTGTYQLAGVNGYGLPAVFTNVPADGFTATATGGVMTLRQDGTYYNRMEFTVVDNGVTRDSTYLCTGTYSSTVNSATFTSAGPGCPTGVRAMWDYDDVLAVDYSLTERARYAR